MLVASVLTMGSVILGTYLSLLGYGYWKHNIDISLAILGPLWRGMWTESALVYLSLFFSLIGVIPYTWMILTQQKQAMSPYFDPDIEIVELTPS